MCFYILIGEQLWHSAYGGSKTRRVSFLQISNLKVPKKKKKKSLANLAMTSGLV